MIYENPSSIMLSRGYALRRENGPARGKLLQGIIRSTCDTSRKHDKNGVLNLDLLLFSAKCIYFRNSMSGSGYFYGHSLTVADLTVFWILSTLQSGVMDHVPTNIVNTYPHLTTFMEKIMSLLAISALYGK